MTRRTFLLLAALVALLALGVREWMVLASFIPEPAQGDASGYLRYALHLAMDGTFSQAPMDQPAVPDAYRSPGYPWFLLLLLKLDSLFWGDKWFAIISHAQAVFGAATVACTIALARQWMPRGFALVAGLWMALQAHHIAATPIILTEVVFGFFIVAGLLCATLALRRRDMRLALLAGGVLAYGYLVNPVMAFLPFLLLPLFWREELLREGAAMALVVLLAIGGWSARNAISNAGGDTRAAINLVQGSWPEFHDSWRSGWRFMDEKKAINKEISLTVRDLPAGLDVMQARMAQDPWRYVRWYVWEKPRLLFDWEIKVGYGMTYAIFTRFSPLDQLPLLGITTIQWRLNALLFWLAFGGLVLAATRQRNALPAAIALVYLTAVHVVFQAEPRYSIPYRSLEIMLGVSALAYLWALLPRKALTLPFDKAGVEVERGAAAVSSRLAAADEGVELPERA